MQSFKSFRLMGLSKTRVDESSPFPLRDALIKAKSASVLPKISALTRYDYDRDYGMVNDKGGFDDRGASIVDGKSPYIRHDDLIALFRKL